MVPILLVVGEITPKTLAIRNNIAFATAQCKPIDLFARLIGPLRMAIRAVADWFTTLIVGAERSPGNIVTQDMLQTLAHCTSSRESRTWFPNPRRPPTCSTASVPASDRLP